MYLFEFEFSLNIVHVFFPEFWIFSLFFFFKLSKFDNTFTGDLENTKQSYVQFHYILQLRNAIYFYMFILYPVTFLNQHISSRAVFVDSVGFLT